MIEQRSRSYTLHQASIYQNVLGVKNRACLAAPAGKVRSILMPFCTTFASLFPCFYSTLPFVHEPRPELCSSNWSARGKSVNVEARKRSMICSWFSMELKNSSLTRFKQEWSSEIPSFGMFSRISFSEAMSFL